VKIPSDIKQTTFSTVPDRQSPRAAIAFAMECYENKLISKADADGLELAWVMPGTLLL
jgi:hypothetical protein